MGFDPLVVPRRAPQPIEYLSDNGSAYTAKETRDFANALNPVPCFTPVRSPESNGMSEAFAKTCQARLCSRELIAGWPIGIPADRRMDRRLQRDPSSLSAQSALPTGVHSSSDPVAGCPAKWGSLHRKEFRLPFSQFLGRPNAALRGQARGGLAPSARCDLHHPAPQSEALSPSRGSNESFVRNCPIIGRD